MKKEESASGVGLEEASENDGAGKMRARISSHSQSLLHLEGDLLKWTNYLGGWQVRHFELKNGVLVYRRAGSKGYECSMTVKDATLGEDTINRCRFTLAQNSVMWHLEARTVAERNQWISALMKCCNDSGYSSMITECDDIDALSSVKSLNLVVPLQVVQQLELHLAQLSASRQLIAEKFSELPHLEMLVETIQNTENIVQECMNTLSAADRNKLSPIKDANACSDHNGNAQVVGESLASEEEWHDAEDAVCGEAPLSMELDASQSRFFEKVTLSRNHVLYSEIDHIAMEQLRYGKAGVEDGVWELFASEGEMKMYKRDLEIDGLVCDPLKATHSVKGVSAREYLHYFFDARYKMDWDSTLDDVKLIEKISEDTMVLHQVHKRVWPAAQRESLFWSHMRRVDSHKDPDAIDAFLVCNHDTERPEVNLTNKACVRVGLTIAMICQTVIEKGSADPARSYTRDNISCRIIYVAQVNPGGWVPSSALRVVYKREYPRFLKRFTQYVLEKTKGRQLEL
ncbi:hypothetical protein QR680_009320 [Steinernema hermaphroditum]|uniref:Ceramide transfer protein n=1 Tax=Steinernema hermaphroditum TaxID=289476 RepID=A0AA39IJU5_9BILA|nr:hypothetical protein QR680_009320 [Steinernema hermaphroditum]